MTPLFVAQAKGQMAMNAAHNLQRGLEPGDDGYLSATPADLAAKTGADPNLLKHMFGGVRPGTKTKKIGRSKYVDPIARELGIQQTESMEIRIERADLVRALNSLPDDLFTRLQADIKRLVSTEK